MHCCAVSSLLPLLHCQPPHCSDHFCLFTATFLHVQRSAAVKQRVIALLFPRTISSWNSIAAATSLPLAACADRQIFVAARCFPASLFALPLHHFSSHAPRWWCAACSLARFIFTATRSLFTAAVVALHAAIDAAESLCQRKTFCFSLSLFCHSAFSRPILACAHSCFCPLCAAVLCFCAAPFLPAHDLWKHARLSPRPSIPDPIAGRERGVGRQRVENDLILPPLTVRSPIAVDKLRSHLHLLTRS